MERRVYTVLSFNYQLLISFYSVDISWIDAVLKTLDIGYLLQSPKCTLSSHVWPIIVKQQSLKCLY